MIKHFILYVTVVSLIFGQAYAEESPRPGVTRRLLAKDELVEVEKRLTRSNTLSVEDQAFLEKLLKEQPPTVHILERLRLNELLKKGGEKRR